jgi:AcrR family transcriptional regulator
MTTPVEFQRARRPEQIAARRTAILRAARELLSASRSADVSLGDISERAGLVKSNLLRYFDSREAIFLEILDAEWRAWLDELTPMGSTPPGPENDAHPIERSVAAHIADSLAERPLLCDLISVMAGVLERNIRIEFARDFKRRAAENTDRFAALVHHCLPDLPEHATHQFAGAVFIITAGLWPYAHPTEVVATVSAEMGISDPLAAVRANFRAGLTAQLIGLTAQARGRITAASDATRH